MKKTIHTKLITLALLLSLSQSLLAQWTSTTGGPFGVLALHANSTGLYAASGLTGNHFVQFTSNNGDNWTSISNNFYNGYQVMSGIGNTLYLGIGNSIYQSSDNGVNWTNTSTGLSAYNVSTIVPDGNTLYVGTQSGLYKSTNGGMVWTQVGASSLFGTIRALAIKGDTMLAATSSSGISISTDKGSNWKTLSKAPTLAYAIAIVGNTYIAGTGYGIYTSTDKGSSWTSSIGITSIINSFYVRSNEILAASQTDGVLFSNNGGKTWTAINSGITNLANTAIYSFEANDTYIFAGTSGAIFRRPLSEVFTVASNTDAVEHLSVQISPNPSSGRLTITSEENSQLNVYNTLGQIVLSSAINAGSNELNIPHKGLIVLVFAQGNKTIQKQVIIE